MSAQPLTYECRLNDMQRVYLEHAVAQIAQSGEAHKTEADSKAPLHERHKDGTAIGAIVASHLPEDMLKALRQLGDKSGPPVLVLRNFPIAPLPNRMANPATQYILEGLSYAMGSVNARTVDGAAIAMALKVASTSNPNTIPGAEGQKFHQDYKGEPYINILACANPGGPNITTNFSRSGPEGFTMEYAAKDTEKVKLENGDLVAFRDDEVFHGRDNKGYAHGNRALQTLDTAYRAKVEPPAKWADEIRDRARAMLTPPNQER